MNKITFPVKKLASWFLAEQRELPWRETSDPYAIWVSEVMLQQTQVKAVLPYYKRWMKRFPTLQALADAPIEEVIKYWEGLGYYSRARNLHAGAKEVLEKFGGKLPSSTEDLLSIKGIGAYTKGAIQSFAFRIRSVLVDGNVKRVFARLYGLDLDFSVPKNHKKLEEIIETVLPKKEPWIFNEALMELGALVCTPKKPLCTICPIRDSCFATKLENPESLPVKPKRKKRVVLYRVVFVLHFKDHFLVRKESKGVMQDLYEFPYLETSHKSHEEIKKEGILTRFLKKKIKNPTHLPQVTHGFTHHHVTLFPFQIDLKTPLDLSDYQWMKKQEVKQKPFSAGHRKILKLLK